MTHPAPENPLFKGDPTEPLIPTPDYSIVPQDSTKRPTWYASNDLYTSLASSIETDLGFNAFDFFLPVGGGPPLHYHVYENEAWYGLEGDLVFSLGNQPGDEGVEPEYTLNVPPETLVFGPRFRAHTYNNLTSTEAEVGENLGARTLSFTTPGGLDLFFDYVGIPVEDRDSPIPLPGPPTPETLAQLAEIGARSSGAPYFILPDPDYQPPETALDYVLVLPEDADAELVEAALPLAQEEGFSIWQLDGDENLALPTRPTFTGDFGIEYTSLLTLEETGNEMEYNQFSLAAQSVTIGVGANLSGTQVIEPTASTAGGNASLQLNEAEEIEYSLTLSGLDFGDLGADYLTAENELDDVTALHIHAGDRDSNGAHVFKIFDPQQQEDDPTIVNNDDGTVTVSGTWSPDEAEIPVELKDFVGSSGLPGAKSNFYFQVHTQGNETGEIRGQIGITADDFPEPIVSENPEALYVKSGSLSLLLDDEIELVEPDTFVYIAPGQEYAWANFGSEPVESLAVTIPSQPEPDRTIASPLTSQADTAFQDIFLGAEADVFHVPQADNSRVYGADGNDELFATSGDRLFGDAGNDLLDASSNGSYNLLDGGAGNDKLLAGGDGELNGGAGDDILRIRQGGNNLLRGGEGTDQFWLANGSVADTVVEERRLADLGLPLLTDTRNTIVDFELGVDRLGIGGLPGVDSFADLKLLPAFGDLRSTSILAEIDGIEGEVSLGNVVDVYFSQLTAADFVFA